MRRFLAFALVLITFSSFAVAFKVDVTLDDFKAVAQSAISIPEVQQLLGSGEKTIRFRVSETEAFVKVDSGSITDAGMLSPKAPDFTISMSRDTMLSILNVEDKAAVFKQFLDRRMISVSTSDVAKQAALKAALSSGLLKSEPFGEGSKIYIGGKEGVAKKLVGSLESYRVKIGEDDFVVNSIGAPIGSLSRRHDFFSSPPQEAKIFFGKPPGVLAQNPGLIYDTVTGSPNAIGPHNIFKINPGLIGPNDILRLNPGLLGPADIGILNPNLHGPREFAYVMGIGAHSNTAKVLRERGLVNDNALDINNRWGNRR